MIYCFGNSHVAIFSGSDEMVPIWPLLSHDLLPWFRTYRIGAVTAYQAYKHLDTINKIISITGVNKQEDYILLVFGEVDIRAHIVEQSLKQGKDLSVIISEVVERYCRALSQLKTDGFKVTVFGCIAGFILQEGGLPIPWPHSGTLEERNWATRIFNKRLNEYCDVHNIPFVSVFEEMLEKDGITTKIKYLDLNGAGCHANTKLLPLILWKFRDIGLIPFDAKIPSY